jgi:predicted DNA-binding transcriptional regulator AlpA
MPDFTQNNTCKQAPFAAVLHSPQTLAPLAVDIRGLAALLQRSVASLHRDRAAGRLPPPVKIGGSVRWRIRDIALWLELACPPADEFAARLAAREVD